MYFFLSYDKANCTYQNFDYLYALNFILFFPQTIVIFMVNKWEMSSLLVMEYP
jgi:hypothetical protein